VPSDFEYQLQALARAGIEPKSRLQDADEVRLSAAKRTVDQNYFELDEYIDGDLRTNPVFICRREQVEEEGFEALRLLHNYLASLYSLNETIRVLCNRYTSDSVEVNYPALLVAFGDSWRTGLPDSTTRLADTEVVSTAVAVSTGMSSE
jgi:hypothetical protein